MLRSILINKRLISHQEIISDNSVRLIYFKDIVNSDNVRDWTNGIAKMPLGSKEKTILTSKLCIGNHIAVYELKSPSIIIYKWPNGELRYFLISSNQNLIEANDSSVWDSSFPFIGKSLSGNISFDIKSSEEIEICDRSLIWMPNTANYAHFCADFYSPLAALIESNVLQNKDEIYTCPMFTSHGWQDDFFDLLCTINSSANKIYYDNSFSQLLTHPDTGPQIFLLKPKSIIFPTIPNIPTSLFHLRNILRLHLSLSKSISIEPRVRYKKPILLTRHDSRRLRISNIEEIEHSVLRKKGHLVNPTNLSLENKLNIFSRYAVFIAESSGCTNYWLFGNSNSRLIALIDQNSLYESKLLLGGWVYMVFRSDQTEWLVGSHYKILEGSPLGSNYYDSNNMLKLISNGDLAV